MKQPKAIGSSHPIAQAQAALATILLALLCGSCSSGGSTSAPGGSDSTLSTDPARAGQLADTQRSINEASPGDEVLIGPGELRGRLVITKSITLVGSGVQTVLRGILGDNDAVIQVDSAADVVVRDLKIIESHAGIRIRDSVRVRLEALVITDHLTEGVDVRSSGDVLIVNCDLHDSVGHGLRVRDASVGVEVRDCSVSGNFDHGVEIRDSIDISLSGVVASSNVQSGVRVRDSANVSIVDNDVDNNGEYGIRLRGIALNAATLRSANRLIGNTLGDVRADQ